MFCALTLSSALRVAVRDQRRALSLLLLLLFGFSGGVAAGAPSGRQVKNYKSDDEVIRRKGRGPQEVSSVIVTLVPGAELPAEFKRFARLKGKLGIINGQVLDLPNGVIAQLERHPRIFRIHYNRSISAHNYRTSLTVGSRAVQRSLGLTGAGIGIAVLDSGITAWHDDPTNRSTRLYPYGNQRVSAFVDFVNGRDHDDGDVFGGEVALELCRHLITVHTGHHDVEQDEIGWLLCDCSERFFAAGRGQEKIAFRPEHDVQQLSVLAFIIHNQNAGCVASDVGRWARAHTVAS